MRKRDEEFRKHVRIEVAIGILLWIGIFTGFYFWFNSAKADIVDWKDTQHHFFECITNAGDHLGLDPITKLGLCLVVDGSSLGSVTITNSCNRHWKSYHHGPNCSAADFYFDDYEGRSIEGMAVEYVDNLYQMVKFLESVPYLRSRMGIGIYLPYKKKNGKWSSNGLIIHVDSRGKPSRWSRFAGGYHSIDAGINRFLKDLGGNHPQAKAFLSVGKRFSQLFQGEVTSYHGTPFHEH